MRSESTRFLGQPRLMKEKVALMLECSLMWVFQQPWLPLIAGDREALSNARRGEVGRPWATPSKN